MPQTNKTNSYPIDWEEKPLGTLYNKIRNGFVGTATPYYVENGIKYLQGKDIKNGRIIEKDIININDDFHKKQIKSQLKLNDIVMVQSGHVGECAVVREEFVNSNCHALIIMSPSENVNSYFYSYIFNSNIGKRLIYKIKTGNTIEHILASDMKALKVPVPPLKEQQKIASILSTWDKAIELKEKLIEQKKEQKKGLMQKLLTGEVRLPGFDGKWEKVDFEEVFIRIPVKKYQIKTTEYLKSGKFPVIDQGKQKIVAYSNNAEKVYQVESKGVIVFGDHTRERKFIDFDFIVGADGTQVLDTNDGYNNKFYFYCLLHQNIPNTGYNRHFKFLKEMWFFKPSLNEQVKIAEILSKIDKEIDLINKELEELKHQKQGLMQLLLTGKIRVKV